MTDSQLVDAGSVTYAPPAWVGTGASPSDAECSVSFNTTFGTPPHVVLSSVILLQNQGWALSLAHRFSVSVVTTTGFTFNVTRGFTDSDTYAIQVLASWIAIGEPGPIHGPVIPRYKVLTVIYAPPGTSSGKAPSSVSYEQGSTTGTSSSSSKTFKQGHAVSAEAIGGVIGNSNSFTYSRSATDSESIEIKKANSTKLECPGPPVDGIDHNRDRIWLWLNPKLDLGLTSSAATWAFTGEEAAVIEYVYVGQLNGTFEMGPVGDTLSKYGITPMDYPDILRHDPLASGSVDQYPDRFKQLNFTFPYVPPPSSSDSPDVMTYTVSNNSTSTLGTAVESSSVVGASISLGGSFLELVKASMKSANTWEWTDKSSLSTSSGYSESASIAIRGPSYGYKGSTIMAVYFDRLYRTFAFVPVTASISLRGTLVSPSGTPIPWEEVSVLSSDGVATHRTLTNQQGVFFLTGDMDGDVTIRTKGVTKTINSVRTVRTIEIRSQK